MIVYDAALDLRCSVGAKRVQVQLPPDVSARLGPLPAIIDLDLDIDGRRAEISRCVIWKFRSGYALSGLTDLDARQGEFSSRKVELAAADRLLCCSSQTNRCGERGAGPEAPVSAGAPVHSAAPTAPGSQEQQQQRRTSLRPGECSWASKRARCILRTAE